MNITKKLSLIMERLLGIIGGVGILIITANAFCRFVLKIPMSWSDEFLRTIMIYGYFIGAAIMFCEGGIMRLEILDGALKDKHVAYKILNGILYAINSVFFGLMGYLVLQMVLQYMHDGTTQSTSSTPAWILPSGCLIGMAIIAIAAVIKLVRSLTARRQDKRII